MLKNDSSKFHHKFTSKNKSYFSSYLKESSIHSFNFLADSRNQSERIFWLLTFGFSMTGNVLMILKLYRTMDFKAVNIIIDDQATDVSEIPFPAVTIFARFPNVFKLWNPEIQSLNDFREIAETSDEVDMSLFDTFVHPTSRL